ncbi:MAG: insulinase family protein [Oscillospiraceae bacterium]|jgi:predicted Zn-dependent peptidase|nr:insulinase family protein [Oscillospiraceae bacterium]
MINGFEKTIIADKVDFYLAKEQRFTTERLTATILLPLKKSTAAEYAILARLLVRCCKEHPTFTLLSKKLAKLYGSGLDSSVLKMGENQAIVIMANGISNKYAITGEDIIGELCGLLCKVIFEPRVENGEFFAEDVEQERRLLLEQIDSEFNEKRSYALKRTTEIMCEGEDYGVMRYGDRAAVEAVTPKSLYVAWQRMLQTAVFNFSFVGKTSPATAQAVIKENFSKIIRTPAQLQTKVVTTVADIKNVNEPADVAQAKLIMGFRTGSAESLGDTFATRLAIFVLGGNASSKLFVNVREKLSLCYYCSARSDRQKGLMFIDSGVEKENIEKAKAAILSELDDMKNGKISDFEIEAAKLNLCNSARSYYDTASGCEAWLTSQYLDRKILTIEQFIERINEVTLDEIVEASQKLVLDTVYCLS